MKQTGLRDVPPIIMRHSTPRDPDRLHEQETSSEPDPSSEPDSSSKPGTQHQLDTLSEHGGPSRSTDTAPFRAASAESRPMAVTRLSPRRVSAAPTAAVDSELANTDDPVDTADTTDAVDPADTAEPTGTDRPAVDSVPATAIPAAPVSAVSVAPAPISASPLSAARASSSDGETAVAALASLVDGANTEPDDIAARQAIIDAEPGGDLTPGLDAPPAQQFASRRERRSAERRSEGRAARSGSASSPASGSAPQRSAPARRALTALLSRRHVPSPRLPQVGVLSRVTVGIALLVVVAALIGIVTPVTITNVDNARAHAQYTKATDRLEAARTAFAGAQTAWESRVSRAAADHTVFHTIVTMLPASLVDPADDRSAFIDASAHAAAVADLPLTDDGSVAQETPEPRFTDPGPAEAATVSVPTDRLRDRTREVMRLAGITDDAAERLTDAVSSIDRTERTAVSVLDDLMTAAHDQGASVTFDKASDDARQALQAAVTALVADIPDDVADTAVSITSDPPEEPSTPEPAPELQLRADRVAAYVAAYTAAEDSQKEAVRAEKKAEREAEQKRKRHEREERERQKQERQEQEKREQEAREQEKKDAHRHGHSDDSDRGHDSDHSRDADRPPGHGSSNRGQVRKTGGTCSGWGGFASGAWDDDIVIPRRARTWWVNVESPRQRWSVRWICDGA